MQGQDCCFKDLRINDKYLSEKEEVDWEEQNILYNTLWFSIRSGGPDIEFCDSAIDSYKQIQHYYDWKEIYHSGGKTLITQYENEISADIMTGWWNPFKKIMGLDKSKKRKILIDELLIEMDKMKSKSDESRVIGWMVSRSKCNKNTVESFLNFLRVVYTPGNLIPSAVSYKSGSGLDGWDVKLENIRNAFINHEGYLKPWREYIEKNFDNDWKVFIKKNKLEMYYQEDDFEFENPVALFGDEGVVIKEATDSNWGNYFKNAHDKISKRNAELKK